MSDQDTGSGRTDGGTDVRHDTFTLSRRLDAPPSAVWTERVGFLARTGDGSADLPHLRGATALRLNGLAVALRPTKRPGHPTSFTHVLDQGTTS